MIEAIVVDSGSTDETNRVIDSFGSRITAHCVANVGPSAARNLGAQSAKGEFIVFLDGDDLLREGCVHERVALIEAHPDAELVVGALRIVDSRGQPLRTEGLALPHGQRLSYETMLGTMYGPTCGLTLRRAAFLDMGGYDESLMIAEDSDLVIRAAARTPLVYDAEPRADYRQAGVSLSRRWVLWYDSYRRMIKKNRLDSPDQHRFDQIVNPKFRDLACNMLFAKPLKDSGPRALPVVLTTIVKRPSLIPLVGFWLARIVRNRIRGSAPTPM